jgi:transposase
MAMPSWWKIGTVAAGLIVAMLGWNGLSRYVAGRQADEITRESARTAELEARLARAHARQYQAQLAATLKRQREELAYTYQQGNEQARQYQAELAIRQERQRQEALRMQASYHLDRNQQCAGGIVINRSGSSFTQIVGKDGKPIPCHGDTATEPLR